MIFIMNIWIELGKKRKMNNDYSKFEQYVKGILNSEIISKVIGNRLEVKEENDAGKSNRSGHFIEITNIKNSIVLGLDCSDRNIYFLSKNTKINDQIILYFNNNTLKVILLELKSKKIGHYKKQLLMGKAYIEFILSILKAEKEFNIPIIEYRGFVFTTDERVRKQPTRRKKSFIPDEETSGIKIKRLSNNASYNFNELIIQ